MQSPSTWITTRYWNWNAYPEKIGNQFALGYGKKDPPPLVLIGLRSPPQTPNYGWMFFRHYFGDFTHFKPHGTSLYQTFFENLGFPISSNVFFALTFNCGTSEQIRVVFLTTRMLKYLQCSFSICFTWGHAHGEFLFSPSLLFKSSAGSRVLFCFRKYLE